MALGCSGLDLCGRSSLSYFSVPLRFLTFSVRASLVPTLPVASASSGPSLPFTLRVRSVPLRLRTVHSGDPLLSARFLFRKSVPRRCPLFSKRCAEIFLAPVARGASSTLEGFRRRGRASATIRALCSAEARVTRQFTTRVTARRYSRFLRAMAAASRYADSRNSSVWSRP
jgi:hypothetical protein